MKKNDIVSGKVYRVDFPDKGYVKIKDEDSEHVMKVKGVLPGQEILARVTRRRIQAESGKEQLEGRLESVVSESPDSVLSPCPHFGECGGCAYLNLPYEKAAALKEEQVKRLLAPVLKSTVSTKHNIPNILKTDSNDSVSETNHTVGLRGSSTDEDILLDAPVWNDLLISPEVFCYRNKMEFTFGDAFKGGPLTLGMHKLGHFHDIVSVPDCQIVDSDYRLILQTTLSFFAPLYEKGKVSFYNRMQKSGYLRHLLVRKGIHAGEILIDLITTSQVQEADLLSAYKDELLNIASCLNSKIAGILHTTNDAEADAIIDQGTEILYGRDSFEETLLGITFTVTPFSFFQTNSGGAEVLYSKVREYCAEALCEKRVSTIYDLYCGTGTITQLMAPFASEVVGVEIVPEAVDAARVNAEKNGITNVRFICGDVLKEIEHLDAAPDLMILDPPRDGIHPKALPKLLHFGAKHIIYVSCKPTSLVRDLPYILAHGYSCKRISCVDQFPWTRHIETVVLLSKGDIDSTSKSSSRNPIR